MRRGTLVRKYPKPQLGYFNNVLKVKKIIIPDPVLYPTGGVGAAVAYARSWRISDMDDIADYTNLYDQYRITGINIEFVPRINMTHWTTGVGTVPHYGYVVYDFDDDNTPTSDVSMRANGSCQIIDLTKPYKKYFEPRTNTALWAGAVASGYAVNKGGTAGPWIDLVNTGVRYYALKLITPVLSPITNLSYGFDILYTMFVEFRGQR